MTEIPSYPKIWALGNSAVGLIFSFGDEVVVQEKVDGSQFSFGRINGEIVMRSKGMPLHADNPAQMFALGIDMVMAVADRIENNTIFRGEYLNRPKHNTIAYGRTPTGHVALFDMQIQNPDTLEWEYQPRNVLVAHAWTFGLEAVPELYRGVIATAAGAREFLDRDSFLGGSKIEGFVVKNYERLTRFGDAMFAKFVSEAFKETHTKSWKNRNPTGRDFVEMLASEFASGARFTKGVQHLRERGELEDDPRDIGKLMKELALDLKEEHEPYIRDRLFEH